MADKQWVLFFREEAHRYLDNDFTKNTLAEVDFIIRELGLSKGQSILDVGCGTGRHSLELARRGYRCTGIDQSPDMLAVARRLNADAGLTVSFVEGDASTTRLEEQFDHAICLCEGAFSLLEQGTGPVEYHVRILRNIGAMLKAGGMFLLTALNGLGMIRAHSDQDVADGLFDPLTITSTEQQPGPEGASLTVVEKGFLPFELRDLMQSSGFEVLAMWGGTAGGWEKRVPQLDEVELMVLARRRLP